MGLLARYDARVYRALATRFGEERARREARAQARFSLVVLVWTVPIFLAAVANMIGRPGYALLLYGLAVVWLPMLVVAWRRVRRARSVRSTR